MARANDIHELLPWFVAGTLAPAEAEAFRLHLDTCDACQSEAQFMQLARQQLAEHGETLLDGHPSVDDLVGTMRGEWDGPRADAVRRHLALCPECALEARWAGDEAVVGGPAVAAEAARGAWARPGWGWLVAAAAIFLALVLLPPVLDRPGTELVRLNIVELRTRAGAEPSTVAPAPGSKFIRLVVPVDFAAADFPVSAEILDDKGRRVIFLQDITAPQLDNGYAGVDCSTRACRPGLYEIRLQSQADAEQSRLLQFRVIEPATP